MAQQRGCRGQAQGVPSREPGDWAWRAISTAALQVEMVVLNGEELADAHAAQRQQADAAAGFR